MAVAAPAGLVNASPVYFGREKKLVGWDFDNPSTGQRNFLLTYTGAIGTATSGALEYLRPKPSEAVIGASGAQQQLAYGSSVISEQINLGSGRSSDYRTVTRSQPLYGTVWKSSPLVNPNYAVNEEKKTGTGFADPAIQTLLVLAGIAAGGALAGGALAGGGGAAAGSGGAVAVADPLAVAVAEASALSTVPSGYTAAVASAELAAAEFAATAAVAAPAGVTIGGGASGALGTAQAAIGATTAAAGAVGAVKQAIGGGDKPSSADPLPAGAVAPGGLDFTLLPQSAPAGDIVAGAAALPAGLLLVGALALGALLLMR